ncbi:MAG TPA: hypothetical protein VM283_09300, partial [Armatimonadota bacterium]|nr:hypothetical protein [Armatimonadota bacterium]
MIACVPVLAQCSFDAEARTLTNGPIAVQLPAVGQPCEVAILRDGQAVAPRHWYYLVAGGMQQGRRGLRSSGRVLSIEPVEATPERATVRVTSLTDDPDDPELGVFVMSWTVERDRPVVRHEMTFTPREPLALRSYEFFVATDQAGPETHRLHYFESGTQLSSAPAQTAAAYGRIPFPHHLAWLGLEDIGAGRTLAVGVPPVDVTDLVYCIEFKRFEISRSGGQATPDDPLHDFALLGAGDDVAVLADLYRQFAAEVTRPARGSEPPLPAVDLSRPAPTADFGVGVAEEGDVWRASAGDVRADISRRTGAVAGIETGAGQVLARPGGIEFVQWPERTVLGPEGEITDAHAGDGTIEYAWRAADLRAHHRIKVRHGCIAWAVEVSNDRPQTRLLEVRLALPVAMTGGQWYSWNGLELSRVSPDSSPSQLTTLVPGEVASQGIFPAVCLHSDRTGLAMGMEPMHIESVYGSRLDPASAGADVG